MTKINKVNDRKVEQLEKQLQQLLVVVDDAIDLSKTKENTFYIYKDGNTKHLAIKLNGILHVLV